MHIKPIKTKFIKLYKQITKINYCNFKMYLTTTSKENKKYLALTKKFRKKKENKEKEEIILKTYQRITFNLQ